MRTVLLILICASCYAQEIRSATVVVSTTEYIQMQQTIARQQQQIDMLIAVNQELRAFMSRLLAIKPENIYDRLRKYLIGENNE